MSYPPQSGMTADQTEVERLRGLLAQALDLLEETSDYAAGGSITRATDLIRRETGIE